MSVATARVALHVARVLGPVVAASATVASGLLLRAVSGDVSYLVTVIALLRPIQLRAVSLHVRTSALIALNGFA